MCGSQTVSGPPSTSSLRTTLPPAQPWATFGVVREHGAGLVALPGSGGGRALERLREPFADRLYAELVDRWGPADIDRCDARAEIAAGLDIPTVVTNDVRYARPGARELYDVLRCIDLGTTVDAAAKPAGGDRGGLPTGGAGLPARVRHPPPR